jgi:hypothetical protein
MAMGKKLKLGKISVTVFLTALIWVWADLAQDEQLELSGLVTVHVAAPADPNLWVTLQTEGTTLRPSMTFKRVVLQGPASRVAEVERRSNKGELNLDLYLSPEQMGLTETSTRTLEALSFLRQSKEFRQLGLTVETCEPNTLTIQVHRLTPTYVTVECVDERGSPVGFETLEPLRVRARVPPDGVMTARVRLTADEQKQAREEPISKTPYIDLPDGLRKEAMEPVKIKLPPMGDVLRQYPVQATLGICMSQNLQGKYKVELREDPTIDFVLIRATPAAHQDYDKMPFHMILNVEDSDKSSSDYISREVVFNFPREYVRKDEIKLDQSVPKVQFRLVPITPSAAPSSAAAQ